MGLSEALNSPAKKSAVVADCCSLVDEEVRDKGGLSGLAVKAGYAAVKGIKPGFVAEVIDKLLPEFAEKLDGMWQEGKTKGDPVSFLTNNKGRAADALLSITDAKAKRAKNTIAKGAYEKLRGSAKKNVEDAIPRLAKLLLKHDS